MNAIFRFLFLFAASCAFSLGAFDSRLFKYASSDASGYIGADMDKIASSAIYQDLVNSHPAVKAAHNSLLKSGGSPGPYKSFLLCYFGSGSIVSFFSVSMPKEKIIESMKNEHSLLKFSEFKLGGETAYAFSDKNGKTVVQMYFPANDIGMVSNAPLAPILKMKRGFSAQAWRECAALARNAYLWGYVALDQEMNEKVPQLAGVKSLDFQLTPSAAGLDSLELLVCAKALSPQTAKQADLFFKQVQMTFVFLLGAQDENLSQEFLRGTSSSISGNNVYLRITANKSMIKAIADAVGKFSGKFGAGAFEKAPASGAKRPAADKIGGR